MSVQPTIKLNDGHTMPQFGLGVWRVDDGDEVVDSVRTAIENGYRMIDTAMVYRNESGVGEGIRQSGVPREELFITTKLWNSDQGAGNVKPALEASLKRLGLDYIDLYLIHWPTPARDLYVETWKEFEQLQRDGLTRSIGVSNFHVDHLERLKSESDVVPAVNQIELHPGFIQKDIRDYCEANGIAVESWSPLGQGGDLLSDPTITGIAEQHDKTAAQVIIKWHLQHGLIVIPKSTNAQRIKQNVDVFDFELSMQDMEAIDQLGDGNRIGPNPDTMNNS